LRFVLAFRPHLRRDEFNVREQLSGSITGRHSSWHGLYGHHRPALHKLYPRLLAFITYRMVYWRKYYERPIHTNQVFILIYNLLLADFQQALSFIIAFHWVSMNELIGPTTACFAEAWLIQIGDVSSGLFVLSIAVHTFISLVRQKTIPMKIFILAVVSVWMFCLLLTLLGPSLNPKDFFVPAGAWVSYCEIIPCYSIAN
jgi:hypothetical protein